MKDRQTQKSVRERYAGAAREVLQGKPARCCSGKKDPISIELYDQAQSRDLPEAALLASLGCGNPTALAELGEGETVLDLGSGGGVDVLLSAKRVGPRGKACGLDMTDDMLELARANQARAGATNVEFLQGEIESIPLPDESVDVIISNCVINLSADKDAVFRECFRVIKPGGRLAIADIVTKAPLPPEITSEIDFWTGCVSGALVESDYIFRLHAAGFESASIEPVRTYSAEEAQALLASKSSTARTISADAAAQVAHNLYSGFVRATKPLP
ncbi:MAG: arsenite methyltransferase [Armatimonadetes bacterium]|nr:arsenite methyltransferase [Armatimonadota bacterium]